MIHKKPYPSALLHHLVWLGLVLLCGEHVWAQSPFQTIHGAIVRGDTSQKKLTLVFTGHEYAEGGSDILKTLKDHQVPASFFFTGDFYRNPSFASLIKDLLAEGHYLGAHSDKHLLYCDWDNREQLLVSREKFENDLLGNYSEMEKFGIRKEDAPYFLPPYEWYNDSISQWTQELGLQLINFTHGTRSHADYTHPAMSNYTDSEAILKSIWEYEQTAPNGLNGFILLVHIGAGPERTDKFYKHLPILITGLRKKGYEWVGLKALLSK